MSLAVYGSGSDLVMTNKNSLKNIGKVFVQYTSLFCYSSCIFDSFFSKEA